MTKAKIEEFAKEDYTKYKHDFDDFSHSTFEAYSRQGFFECYVQTLYFKNWKEGLNSIHVDTLNCILDELHHDINSSYYLATIGLYRTSNMHLRSMIELSLQLVYFYEHPIEFLKWKEGNFVIKHDVLNDYIKTHPIFVTQEQKTTISTLMDQITEKWKFYSKHIHAESLTYFQTQRESAEKNEFTIADFGRWKSNYIKTTKKINNLLLLFFSNELKRFPSNNKDLIKIDI